MENSFRSKSTTARGDSNDLRLQKNKIKKKKYKHKNRIEKAFRCYQKRKLKCINYSCRPRADVAWAKSRRHFFLGCSPRFNAYTLRIDIVQLNYANEVPGAESPGAHAPTSGAGDPPVPLIPPSPPPRSRAMAPSLLMSLSSRRHARN